MQPRRISIAPMMNFTDRHCRIFHRQITQYSWLYTEMITTDALLHGDVARHLTFNTIEHPVALQLGGNKPIDLAKSAKLGEKWGYDEINLNCGCPSSRVQNGAFGASLMKKPTLVADCIKAMSDAVSIEITVKHRIGINHILSYNFLCDFVGTLIQAGCNTFIIHARNAILQNFNPKENRKIPLLKYDVVYRLKRDFLNSTIILNGGVKTLEEIDNHLQYVDGVMLGREVYYNPFLMASFDIRYYPELSKNQKLPCRTKIINTMIAYAQEQLNRHTNNSKHNLSLHHITRHMLGLAAKIPGARIFRQILSDSKRLKLNDPTLLLEALSYITTNQKS